MFIIDFKYRFKKIITLIINFFEQHLMIKFSDKVYDMSR